MDNGLKAFGIAATGLYAAGVGYYVFVSWLDFQGLPPNAVGDFLAGSFSPLAFLWLVLGFFQQGKELRLTNDALQLQAEELRNSVEQQRELVSVTREQVFADIESARLERDRRAAAMEPVFAFAKVPGQVNGDGYNFRTIVTNAGNKVTQVHVSIDNDRYRLVSGPDYPVILHAGVMDLSVVIDNFEDFSDLTVQFSYVREEGGVGSLSYLLKAVDPPRNIDLPYLERA